MDSKEHQKIYRQTHLVEERNRDKVRNRTVEGRYRLLKGHAKERGIGLTLSLEAYRTLIETSVCLYCFGQLPEAGSGLDRVNRTQGYTEENVVPCCTVCNKRKGRLESLGFSPRRVLELMAELAGW